MLTHEYKSERKDETEEKEQISVLSVSSVVDYLCLHRVHIGAPRTVKICDTGWNDSDALRETADAPTAGPSFPAFWTFPLSYLHIYIYIQLTHQTLNIKEAHHLILSYHWSYGFDQFIGSYRVIFHDYAKVLCYSLIYLYDFWLP